MKNHNPSLVVAHTSVNLEGLHEVWMMVWHWIVGVSYLTYSASHVIFNVFLTSTYEAHGGSHCLLHTREMGKMLEESRSPLGRLPTRLKL